MNNKERRDINRKLKVLNYGIETANVSRTCRYFSISRATYYRWKRSYEKHGELALINSKPCPVNPKLRLSPELEEKILYICKSYYLGQQRISWYLERYHGIKVSPTAVRNVLVRHG